MLASQDAGAKQANRRKTLYVLIGVVALAALVVCIGVASAQAPRTESMERHEQLAQLGLTADGPKKPPMPRKLRCRLAARGLARSLSRMARKCAKMGPKRVNKRKCIRAIKKTLAFPFLHVIDEPKELAKKSRRPVSSVFNCAEDLFDFMMGKPKKGIRESWSFGTKGFGVVASGCTPKGVSAFLRPPTNVVKIQGKKVLIVGKDFVFKIDARRVKRRLKISKLLITGILDLSAMKPKSPMEMNVDDGEEIEDGDDNEDEDDVDEVE